MVAGVRTWPDLPPFAFSRTQDRENGKNLCRSHPKPISYKAADRAPWLAAVHARIVESFRRGEHLVVAPFRSQTAISGHPQQWCDHRLGLSERRLCVDS